MSHRLAKLRSIKHRLDMHETGHDAVLLQMIADATALAERLAGLEPDALRYQAGIVEYPQAEPGDTLLYLAKRPCWSVAEVVESRDIIGPATDDDFDAADPLVEFNAAGYMLSSPMMAELSRLGAAWYTRPRNLRVTYTGGFMDPAVSQVTAVLATATYTAVTRTLTQAGAFADYTFTPGDVIQITGGTGATPGAYLVASRVDDDSITLSSEGPGLSTASGGGGDLATGDITSFKWSNELYVPGAELQAAIELQTIRLFQSRATAGLREINAGQGGSISMAEAKPHPALVDWAKRFKRRFF